jgi:hypothetical protein
MPLCLSLRDRPRSFNDFIKNCSNVACSHLPTVGGVRVKEFGPVKRKELMNGIGDPPFYPVFRRGIEHLTLLSQGLKYLRYNKGVGDWCLALTGHSGCLTPFILPLTHAAVGQRKGNNARELRSKRLGTQLPADVTRLSARLVPVIIQ